MKKLLLSLILMIFAAQLSAQSLAFKYEGESVEPGTTINIVSDINASFEIQFDLDIINTTDADINVVAQMEDLTNIGSTYLCWGSCYMPGTFEATHPVAAGGEGVFNGHVMFVDADWNTLPVGTEVKMVYTFFDERTPEETYSFNVNFKYQTEEVATSALAFKYEGESVEPGTTINIVSDINASFEIQFDLDIINTTDADINVVAQMEDLTNIGSTYLCWGSCYMPGTLEATHPVAAGGEGVFNGHVMFVDADWNTLPVGTEIKMVYTFFDERNPEETYTFNVNFKYQTESIVDYNSVDVFSNAYPNPANNTVSFDYNMPYDVNSASVAIYNMMGQEVVRQDLNLGGSRADINVSDLNEGVYFYSLIVNNQTVKTNKLVVSR